MSTRDCITRGAAMVFETNPESITTAERNLFKIAFFKTMGDWFDELQKDRDTIGKSK